MGTAFKFKSNIYLNVINVCCLGKGWDILFVKIFAAFLCDVEMNFEVGKGNGKFYEGMIKGMKYWYVSCTVIACSVFNYFMAVKTNSHNS